MLSSSSEDSNRFPATMAKEKLFLACKVASFPKADSSLPPRLPKTMLNNFSTVKSK